MEECIYEIVYLFLVLSCSQTSYLLHLLKLPLKGFRGVILILKQ